jgi:uncharacterized protein (TIRG00374 family)
MLIGGRTYNIKLGLTVFVAISVVAAAVVLYLGVDETTWPALGRMRFQYALLAVGLMIAQWLLNGLRFQILINSFPEKVGFKTSFRAFMANVFLAAMTPSQTGGGPLQIYVLNRAGVPVAKAFAGCLVGAVLTVVCLVVSNLVVLGLSADLRLGMGHHVGTVFTVALAVLVGLAAVFLVSLVRIGWLKRAAGWLVLVIARPAERRRKYSTTKRLMRGLDQYRASMLAFAGAKRRRVVAAGLVTMLAMAMNALIAPTLLAGLNAGGAPVKVFLMQFVVFFIAYFSPTPGASGVAELSNYWLTASAGVQANVLGIFTVIWRFFNSFLGVGVGAVVVLSMLGKWKRNGSVSQGGEPATAPEPESQALNGCQQA